VCLPSHLGTERGAAGGASGPLTSRQGRAPKARDGSTSVVQLRGIFDVVWFFHRVGGCLEGMGTVPTAGVEAW